MRRSTMTRAIAGTLAAGALLLVGCGGDDEPAETTAETTAEQVEYTGPPLPQDIADDGTLVAVLNAENPPGQFNDDSGELVGWEVELTDAIGERLGLDVETEIVPFDSMLTGVQAERYDMAVGSYDAYYFPERLENHDFVPYFKSPGSSLMIKAGNPAGIPEDSFCGMRIGAVRGSYDAGLVDEEVERCAEAGEEPVVKTVYPGANPAMLALDAGRIDAVMNDYAINAYRVDQSGGKWEAIGMYGEPGEYSIGFQKGASELTEAVRWALQGLIDDGTYQEILDEWAVGDGAIAKTAVLTEPK